MSNNLIDVLFVPLGVALITAVMVGVALLLGRREARDASLTAPQDDAVIGRTIRKAS